MEKRKAERVQFFQIPRDENLIPVWVFRQTNMESVLGLLLDINADGAQLLTDKSSQLEDDLYQLTIHPEGHSPADLQAIRVNRQWSKPDGTLYMRHGFTFSGDEHVSSTLKDVLSAHRDGQQWLRCELAKV